jgi:hypothetical protein
MNGSAKLLGINSEEEADKWFFKIRKNK